MPTLGATASPVPALLLVTCHCPVCSPCPLCLRGEIISLTVFAAMSLLIPRAVLLVRVVAGVRSDVASPVPSFVRVEVIERLLSALGHRSFVTVVRIVAVIDVAGEAFGSMEPSARPDEYPAHEKIGSIVAVGSTRFC